MNVIRSNIFHVLEKFPHRAEDIKTLYKENRKFQTICIDYRQCAEALHHWNQSDEKEAPARRQEYEELFEELIDEIRSHLKESDLKKGGSYA